MLRLLLVVLLTALLGSGGVAAASVANVPALVQFLFIGCLTLFVVALARGALTTSDSSGARSHVGSVGRVGPLREDKREELEAPDRPPALAP
ncbi:MAG TPA: hypothetical protein VGK37_08480 [Casimicrobiaceae bacterium]|jgi:uncharacterized membrane protein YtjA (UPF0391 family)